MGQLSCINLIPSSFDTVYPQDAGYPCAIVSAVMSTVFFIYVWLGSFCCECCCGLAQPQTAVIITQQTQAPQVVETTTTTTTTPTPVMTTMVQQPMMMTPQYTLLVHFGNPVPTQLVLNATNLGELCAGLSSQLSISVPFSISVFNPSYNAYIPVSDLSQVPSMATVQLNFVQ